MNLNEVEKNCRQQMTKVVTYFHEELKGVRTGRATPGLIEHLKVNVASYGSSVDLQQLAAIAAPQAALLVVKPYDPATVKDIEKAILASNLGLTPMLDGSAIRLPIPPLSGERRGKLIAEIHKMAEAQRIAVRNARRDANKLIDSAEHEGDCSEDQAEEAKGEVQKLTKQFESQINDSVGVKQKELEQV